VEASGCALLGVSQQPGNEEGGGREPAMATPKLMDICCMVLAMELALLSCSFVMSA
jgi:hypothetical protein